MRERVSTWSKLSAKDKAAARENYKALKEKRQGERNSSWNSYQSLDPKQRDEFKAAGALGYAGRGCGVRRGHGQQGLDRKPPRSRRTRGVGEVRGV